MEEASAPQTDRSGAAAADPRRTPPVAAERVDVSVLIPVLNEEGYLPRTVPAMLAQESAGNVEFLFIDGTSEDGTRALLERMAVEDPRIRVLDNPDRLTPKALNVGLRASRGEFVARMDAHTLYSSRYLAAGIERLRHGDVAWASGPQLAEGTNRWSGTTATALATRLGFGGSPFRLRPDRELEIDSGFTGMWTRATLEALGGWDEEWPVNQDSELAARIRAGGDRIVCLPEMEGRYFARESPRALARQYWRYGQYRAKTSGRHPESMRPSHLLPPGLAATLTLAAILPHPLSRLPRGALLLYCLAVLGATARAEPRSDRLLLPVVFGTMHLAWGFGFLVGSARFGVPAAATMRVLRDSLGRHG
jgi:cellulose synthase/poly-beta-1,6-N-acetylglucosamine synthase-like glycosyltransferase